MDGLIIRRGLEGGAGWVVVLEVVHLGEALLAVADHLGVAVQVEVGRREKPDTPSG